MIRSIRQLVLSATCFALSAGVAAAWSLEEAAKPYKGTQISVIFLDQPGYRAIEKMLPDFEQKTGIKVNYEIVPYESTLEKEVRDFSSNGG
jgi:multiple sugar transport system substrate-binding protein